MLWTLEFWKGLAERAIKTFFQSFVAFVSVSAVALADVDWLFALSAAGLATLLSVATSIGNADFTAGVKPPVIEVADAPMVQINQGGAPLGE